MAAEFRLKVINKQMIMQTRQEGTEDWWCIFGVDKDGYGIRYSHITGSGLKIEESEGQYGAIKMRD